MNDFSIYNEPGNQNVRRNKKMFEFKYVKKILTCTVGLFAVLPSLVLADALADAISSGKAYGDIRMRFESVEQDNTSKDADALTVRTRLGYITDEYEGFSATLEFEDSRVVAGMDDYNNTLGLHTQYSVIADPETTELDQAFLQYKTDILTAKVGRQVITMDNHRFVGHVGWRQDRQTFDGFRLDLNPMEDLNVTYAYLGERNRIYADAKDIDSKDHLLNASYKTPYGKLTGYSYFLEIDNDTDNALDTIGLRFVGSTDAGDSKIIYSAEFASQEAEMGVNEAEAEYLFLEGGIVIQGITAKLGYEVLGSDEGMYGFSTPLATLHKFNGWTDQFLGTPPEGLEDIMLSLSGKVAGGKLLVVMHEFSADESSAIVDDLGSEVGVLYAKKIGKNYNAGIKYAAYSAGDIKVDTDKMWFWVGVSF